MKCDRCENEATVHEVRIEAGKRREKHLCEHCARAEGVAPPQANTPITTLLSNFMLQQNEAAAVPPAAGQPPTSTSGLVCSCCGTTYNQFRQSGLLGCPTCYAQFENQLVPLLARAHEGGTSHTGKSPRRLTPGASNPHATPKPAAAPRAAIAKVDPNAVAKALAERLAMLRKRLAEAIAAEAYEKAAMLRDELATLQNMPQSGTIEPTPAPAKRKPRAPAERPPHGIQPPDRSGEGDVGGGETP